MTGFGQIPEHLLAFELVGVTIAAVANLRLEYLLASAIFFASLLELAQIPLPTRHTRFEDLVIDARRAYSDRQYAEAIGRNPGYRAPLPAYPLFVVCEEEPEAPKGLLNGDRNVFVAGLVDVA